MIDILREIQKINEAYMVRHAIPGERKFTDAELVPTFGALLAAEARLAVLTSSDERTKP